MKMKSLKKETELGLRLLKEDNPALSVLFFSLEGHWLGKYGTNQKGCWNKIKMKTFKKGDLNLVYGKHKPAL